MRNLVNSSLFTFKKTFDYQSLCDPKKESKAAAGLRSVYVVSYISQRPLAAQTEPPTSAHPHSCARTFQFSTHIYLHVSVQEHTDQCKCSCCRSYAYLPAYALLNGHTHVHTHTHSFTHKGAINPGQADEKGSRGHGESVRVGVAVTVTGLGGLACLVM